MRIFCSHFKDLLFRSFNMLNVIILSVIKKLGQKDRNRVINLTFLLAGLIIGWLFLDTPVHELGHYSFAYFFNKSAIEGLYYSPVDVLMGLISFKNLTNGTILAYVKYHGDVFEVFSEPQALLVLLGGLIFELTFFGLVLIALYKLSNKYKKRKNKANLYVRGFLGGIILSMVVMAGGWITDGKQAILHFTENMYFMVIILTLISSVVFYFWYRSVSFSWGTCFKDLFEAEESNMSDFIQNLVKRLWAIISQTKT